MATSQIDPHQSSQDTRLRVLRMALSLRGERSGGPVDQFLVLLQDRLPLWLRVLHGLAPGHGRVWDNLLLVARAGIDYYAEVHPAALRAFAEPALTVRYREAVRDNDLGPMSEIKPLSGYLAAEQRLGRVSHSVTPTASARLLLAGCFHHAYQESFLGADADHPRDSAAAEIIRELRLEPSPDPATEPGQTEQSTQPAEPEQNTQDATAMESTSHADGAPPTAGDAGAAH